MTIREVLKKYHKIEIELLLAHVLRKPKEFLYLNIDRRLTARQMTQISRMVTRRVKGEPVAYILGYKDFYGLRFKVNCDVLIPRLETEVLVERAVKHLTYSTQHDACCVLRAACCRVLDVGTGSGCIIISLAKQMGAIGRLPPDGAHQAPIAFYASDISSEALKVARRNAKILLPGTPPTPVCGRIRFIKSDLLKNIKGDFDIVIANLPYLSEEWELPNLKFEPTKALFAKQNGLALISELLKQAADKKHQPKLIYLEFDPRQKRTLSSLIKKRLPQADVKFYKDFAGLWRCAEISIQQ